MEIEKHIGWADMMVYTHECPKCGTESDVHIGEDADATEKPRYCPACGAPIARMEIETVCAADQMPTRAHEHDAGADLRALSGVKFMPGEIKTVPTGVRVAIPEGYVGLLFARSSLCNWGVMLANGVGVIDSDYTGEVKVPLFNASPRVFELPGYARIAQLVIVPCELPTFRLVKSLEDTERGDGGFGSTGVE